MANETIKFEDKQSKELYNWVTETYSLELIASCHLFIPECIGVLRGFQHIGLKYEWINIRLNSMLHLASLLAE